MAHIKGCPADRPWPGPPIRSDIAEASNYPWHCRCLLERFYLESEVSAGLRTAAALNYPRALFPPTAQVPEIMRLRDLNTRGHE
jgi:hypothetical protein